MNAADAWKALLIVVVTVVMYGGLRVFQVRRKPEPELVRKLFHITAGIIGLSLPWLFDDTAPVLLLGLLVMGALVALRLVPRLRSGLGQVLFGVQRDSLGEIFYVASICLLFWLTGHDKLLYSVPLLILAFADTFAALIGEQYGKLLLNMTGGSKSYEGALAFFLTAFFCVHVPVLLWGGTHRLESLLIGLDLSILVMMAEAAAWWGLDNLIIPVWGYMLLRSLLEMNAAELSAHLAFVLSLGLLLRFWRHHTNLGDDALFGATLWGYVVWAVGGWRWVAPPLIQLFVYAAVTAKTPMDRAHPFRFYVVLSQIAGAFFWLLVYRQIDAKAVFFPFTACFGANLAILALVTERFAEPEVPWRITVSKCAARGMLVVVPSILIMDGFSLQALLDLAAGLLAVYAATAIFCRVQPGIESFPLDPGRWLRQSVVVAVTSTIALGIHYGLLLELPLTDVLNPINIL
jgi:phytol kinase